MNRRSFLLLAIPAAATGCISTGNQVTPRSKKEEIPSEDSDSLQEAQTEQLDAKNQEPSGLSESEKRDSSSERHQAHLRRRRKVRQLRQKKSRKRRLEASRKRRRRLKSARDRRRKQRRRT